MIAQGVQPSRGQVLARVLRSEPLTAVPARELSLAELLWFGLPHKHLPAEVNLWRRRNWRHLWRGLHKIALARKLHLPHHYGRLSIVKIDGPTGRVTDFGLASLRVVTTAGVNYLVDALQNIVEPENLKYHGIGTGAVAEAVGDTALGAELTTQYNPDSTRATGTTTEGASANIFRSVGTNTLDSGTPAVTEHGLFSASSAGTLLDRSVFSAINLNGANGDGLQTTYDYTLSTGG